MSRCVSVFTALAFALFLSASSRIAIAADVLNIGDAAPALEVSDWVKGDKVEKLEPGKTYVVEFWATWCGPCVGSIPHLTELAHEYKDKSVQFVGVDVWEDDATAVQSFVEEMGDKMDYSVAIDSKTDSDNGREGKMSQNWLRAAEENGIPTTFVIHDGKVAWIGHPMGLAEPLAKITAGNWDLAEMAKERLAEKAQERAMDEFRDKIYAPYRDKDYAATLAAIDEATQSNPELADTFNTIRFISLCNSGQIEPGLELGAKLLEKYHDKGAGLNGIFWEVIDLDNLETVDPRVGKLAVQAITRAVELTKEQDPNIIDSLAVAQFRAGDAAAAIATEEKAIKVLQSQADGDQDDLKLFNERIELYRQSAAK